MSTSQPQIQTNFSSIQSWTAVDHIQLGATNAGDHNQVTIPNPQAAPAPAGTTGVYTTQAVSGNSEAFYTNVTKNIQLTNTLLTASSGQGMMPGGLQVRTGSFTVPGSVVFIGAFPTDCLAISLVTQSSTPAAMTYGVYGKDKNGFSVAVSSGTATVEYIAIGY